MRSDGDNNLYSQSHQAPVESLTSMNDFVLACAIPGGSTIASAAILIKPKLRHKTAFIQAFSSSSIIVTAEILNFIFSLFSPFHLAQSQLPQIPKARKRLELLEELGDLPNHPSLDTRRKWH